MSLEIEIGVVRDAPRHRQFAGPQIDHLVEQPHRGLVRQQGQKVH
jgi:hypothetical protein